MAWLHNSRSALVAGLAAGLERPLLILAEDEYQTPFDYQDLVHVYQNERECSEILDRWLEDLNLSPGPQQRLQRKLLTTELRSLRFGEHVAENEAEGLSDYFLETASFDEVINGRNTLFIGRKGTGKTANMLQAAAHLSLDARNLVVVIKPASYEFQSLLTLLRKLPQEVKEYTLTSLWSFLLQSEIARAAVQIVEARPAHIPLTDPERQLLDFVDKSPFALREEFAVRFERTVEEIDACGVINASTVRAGRDLLHEAFHSSTIRRLRSLIGPVLKGRNRVAVLIDNLDKAWDRTTDLNLLSQLLLGLLSAVGRVSVDYEREDFWRNRVQLSLATFLRSDIYAHIQRVAREPDKIPVTTLEWNDKELLLRVIEERFLTGRSKATTAESLWTDFFCDRVHDIDTRTYIASRVLPRPRDIVYFCNSAVQSAVNHRRERVEEDDIVRAERTYSQFAFEALLVENGITLQKLEDVLFEFAGLPQVLCAAQVHEIVARAGIDPDMIESIVMRLRASSFLGTEVKDGIFEFPYGGQEMKRVDVLARRLSETRGSEPRLSIHPAYRAYLEIE